MQQLTRDGVNLSFVESGRGTAPLLFVHGWCCDHSYFAPQMEYFEATHRVVAVDLRGHGSSDKPAQAYTMEGFADDLAWLCQELQLRRPVVVGHSMGGVIALALAARNPALPAAIASLDSPILPPAAVRETLPPLIEALRGPDYVSVVRAWMAEALFRPTDDPARKARIIDAMSSAPQQVMQFAFAQMFAFDHASAAAHCQVPWLALYADTVLSDLPRLRELCPHVITGQTVGAGHFHQLEVPEQINPMLARFLQLVASH